MDQETSFQQMRPQLFSLAYRMLGTRADAEDIVQDAYLRWRSASIEEVRSPKSYLTTVVARLSLDSLKSARRKRETYVGEWLPEPLVEPPGTTAVEMAESLSLAFLHVLETLSPDERVAFLLREVFDAGYSEIAATLDTSESNCRQLISRARKHIRARRPRFQVPATINPIYGADKVSRFFKGLVKKGVGADLSVKLVEVNANPGALLMQGENPNTVVSIQLDVSSKIRQIFLVTNPDKLPR